MSAWNKVIHPTTAYFRRRRGALLKQLFPDIARMTICDLGGSRHFWDKVDLDIPAAHITIYNISADETQSLAKSRYAGVRVELYDGLHVPVHDGYFDLVICNSVLEHVSPTQRQALVAEMLRIGRHGFVQTPNFYFPLEPHFLMPFIHWMPRPLGWKMVSVSPWKLLSKPTDATARTYFWDTQLLAPRDMVQLFKRAPVQMGGERFGGLKKSLYATW